MELTKSEKLEWVKTRYTVFTYATAIKIPTCILLYSLGYHLACWILLGFDILSSIGLAQWLNKKEKELSL